MAPMLKARPPRFSARTPCWKVSCGAPGPLLRPGREAECEPVVVEERVSVPTS